MCREATIMVIEHAERFGLAQLHQLRGRVGRGAAKSSCSCFIKGRLAKRRRARLEILRQTEDGFRIAEEDLRLRGEGEVLGTRQSGVPGFQYRPARPPRRPSPRSAGRGGARAGERPGFFERKRTKPAPAALYLRARPGLAVAARWLEDFFDPTQLIDQWRTRGPDRLAQILNTYLGCRLGCRYRYAGV